MTIGKWTPEGWRRFNRVTASMLELIERQRIQREVNYEPEIVREQDMLVPKEPEVIERGGGAESIG